jgi:hypothetical protein
MYNSLKASNQTIFFEEVNKTILLITPLILTKNERKFRQIIIKFRF